MFYKTPKKRVLVRSPSDPERALLIKKVKTAVLATSGFYSESDEPRSDSSIRTVEPTRYWVNIQFKGHLVSFGYSERIYALCGSEFI